MEFERVLFRIHQRTLHSEPVRKVRLQLERFLPWAVAGLAICLAVLHSDYVGQARCLPLSLRRAGLWNETTGEAHVPNDLLVALRVVDLEEMTGVRLPALSPTRGVANETWGSNSMPVEAAPIDLSKIVVSYKFVLDREILLMSKDVFENHNFKVVNVSMSERCLVPSPLLASAFRISDALDSIVINELAYTLRSRGFLERVDEAGDEVESWAWSEEQVESASPREGRSLFAAAVRKALILFKSVLTFLNISAMTGLFIRVAVNGSAVLMFPIAVSAMSLGFSTGRMSTAVLTRSFPWIGVHIEVLRRGGRPLWPLFRSHIIFLLLMSFAYLSCNLAWRFILYRKSSPEGFEERIFTFCSALELFNLIFVRSENSAVVFPKLALSLVVYLHYYTFCSLYPFHSLALAMCATACAYVMVYCLNHFEEPALRADPFLHTTPTAAHPRALYMPQLSPSWTVESAPLWTMFYLPDRPTTFPEEAMRSITNEEMLMP